MKPAREEWEAEAEGLSDADLKEKFPLSTFVTYKKQSVDQESLVDIFEGKSGEELRKLLAASWDEVERVFGELRSLSALD